MNTKFSKTEVKGILKEYKIQSEHINYTTRPYSYYQSDKEYDPERTGYDPALKIYQEIKSKYPLDINEQDHQINLLMLLKEM